MCVSGRRAFGLQPFLNEYDPPPLPLPARFGDACPGVAKTLIVRYKYGTDRQVQSNRFTSPVKSYLQCTMYWGVHVTCSFRR